MIAFYIICLGKKNKCKKNECWCVSGGGDSCYGTCDPDECHDKIDCPGNGYWCKDEGIIHVIKSILYEFNYISQ